jgi:hypothetical protein
MDTQTPSQQATTEKAEWYHATAVAGSPAGPFTHTQMSEKLASGELTGAAKVWRDGMVEWAPAGQLLPFASFAVPMQAEGVDERKRRKIVSNAKQNMIVLFVLFCLFTLAVAAAITRSEAAKVIAMGGGCAPIAGIFAAIYMPIRWRVIMSLPPGIRTMGLIGGFGCIVVAAVSLIAGMTAGHFYAR